jgi:hypothetical protein
VVVEREVALEACVWIASGGRPLWWICCVSSVLVSVRKYLVIRGWSVFELLLFLP